MKKITRIAEWKNDSYTYRIDQIVDEDTTQIIIINLNDHPYGVLSVIKYKTISYDSCQFPLMSWENLIRCSNYYGTPPEEYDSCNCTEPGYMSLAVQKHLKPAATLRLPVDDSLIKRLSESLPNDCLLLPYKEENTTFICRKGTLSDYYDLDLVRKIYDAHQIRSINWHIVTELCHQEISSFSDSQVTGLYIESGAEGNTQLAFTGLLLGYPVESTVSSINHTTLVVDSVTKYRAAEHYRNAETPFIDWQKQIWNKNDDHIYVSWQNEDLYY